MDINQIYRAPAIPKLSKRNISSSVLRASSAISSTSPVTPKLRTTRFSFRSPINLSEKLEALKPKPLDAEKILSKKQDTEENTYKALAETNRILVEIQKQLSLDFAMRIAEEKEAVKKIKAAESKRKVAEKEKFVEGAGKKIAGIGQSIADRVTAPVKSIFDKIKEFFGLILTGIVYNAAFKWLQDENNRELLDGIFYWIGKAFVPAVIGIIVYKVFKWIRRLYLLGRFLWKLPGRLLQPIKNLPSPYRSSTPPPQSPLPKPSPLSKSPLTRGPGTAPGTAPALPKPLLGPTGQPLPRDPLRGTTPARAPGIPKPGQGITPKPSTSPRGPQLPGWLGKTLRVVGLAFLISELQEDWKRGDIKAIAVKLSAYGLGWLATILTAAAGTAFGIGTAPTGAGAVAGVALAASSMGVGYGVDVGIRKAFGYKDGGTIKASNGMTVPGKGSGFVDSVKAMLAPGEEVIRTTSSMLFRPLLKDINDNAGRLWTLFTQAIRKLFTVSDYQRDVSEEFSKVIEDFNKYLKEEILKNKAKPSNPNNSGNGGFRVPSVSPKPISQPAPVSAAPRITNISMNVSAGAGGMTFLPMVLPKQSSKPPQIPQMQGKATDVPVISPVNFANPYMEVTPGLYGIQLIV